MAGPTRRRQPLTKADPLRLGPYYLAERLGHHGPLVTYLATDVVGVKVAIQALAPEFISQGTSGSSATSGSSYRGDHDTEGNRRDGAVSRLRREADALRRINSPFVARLLNSNPSGDQPWLAVEYFEGPTLDEISEADRRALTNDEFALLRNLAHGLSAIHEAGWVHANLRPEMILITAAGPKIIGLGDAVPIGQTDPRCALKGFISDSEGWIAPEQVRREPLTPEMDVHSWGLVALSVLTGLRPFAASQPADIARKAISEIPQVPRQMHGTKADIPEWLRERITSALAKSPHDRPSTESLALPPDNVPTDDRKARTGWVVLGMVAIASVIIAATSLAAVAMTALANRPVNGSEAGASPAATAQPSMPSPSVAPDAGSPPTLTDVALSVSPQEVQVGGPLLFTARLSTAEAGIELTLEISSPAGWRPLRAANTDAAGSASWAVQAEKTAGNSLYRVSSSSTDAQIVRSDEVAVKVTRGRTENIIVEWPREPMPHCDPQPVEVQVSPPSRGRLVSLQYSEGSGQWSNATRGVLDGDGRVTLQTPGCETESGADPGAFVWRVAVAEDDRLASGHSDVARITMAPPEPECPQEQPISVVQSYMWLIDVVNPSPTCVASVVVSSGLYCEIPPPDIRNESVGFNRAEPFYLDPSEGRRIDMRDLFPNACPSPPYNGMGLSFPNLSAFASFSPPG